MTTGFPKEPDIVIDVAKLKELFAEYHYLASVYLFGSAVSGTRGPMSDVDFALLLKPPHPQGRHLIHEEDYLAYRIQKTLGLGIVDVIDLNSQRLIFQHNVLRSSKLIYDAAADFRIRFVSRVVSEYCDFEPTLRFMNRFHLQGIKERLGRL